MADVLALFAAAILVLAGGAAVVWIVRRGRRKQAEQARDAPRRLRDGLQAIDAYMEQVDRALSEGDLDSLERENRGKLPVAGFVFAIILWLVAVCVAAGGFFADKEYKIVVWAIAVVVAVVGFGSFAIGGLKSVPVKNIGVPQAFGAVTGKVYGAGIHETWEPWLHLTDVDETVQTTEFEQGGANGCLTIRIGGQQQACADVTVQWQILPSAADALFEDYANQGDLMATITDAVVVRELKQVVNEVMGDYNPITDVSSVTNSNTASSEFDTFGPQILAQMRADLGREIDIKTVYLPIVYFSSSVESKLAAIQQAYANYAIAQENVKVSQEQALSYQKLGNPTVEQLISSCLSDLKDETSLPTGFQCFPGSQSGLALSS